MTPKIVTHDGVFHADDALAVFLLKLLPEYQNAEIVRTRNPSIIDSADIVVDVGAVYDHERKRYDHHQRSFTLTMAHFYPDRDWKEIKLSSAGLVYHHYGHRIIGDLLQSKQANGTNNSNTPKGDQPSKLVEIIFGKVYEELIREIDAIDNGVLACPGREEHLYDIRTGLSSRVSNLKPHWNEETTDEILMKKFKEAMSLIGNEFLDRVNYFGKVWWPARTLVQDALKDVTTLDPSGQILDLSNNEYHGGFPWKEHLFTLEKEFGIEGQIKFVIFRDLKETWRVQAVPPDPNSFEQRLPLHPEWQGLRDDDLSVKSGIAGCIFVHATGFIGGNKTKEGVVEMARKSLKKCEETANGP